MFQGEKLRSIVGALLVGAFLLSSCQGEAAEPKGAPQTTAPANPDAKLPPMPAMANEFTQSGASAFVAHYVEVLEYASQTGDVAELERLSRKNCEGCNRYIDLFVGIYEDGGFMKDHDWTIGGIKLLFQGTRGSETMATTQLSISGVEAKISRDEKLKKYGGSKDKVTFGVIFEDGWTVNQFAYGGTHK